MSRLTPVNYDKVVKALVCIGYVVNNQKGSHIVMRLADKEKYLSLLGCRKNETMVVIPDHKPLGKGCCANYQRSRPLS